MKEFEKLFDSDTVENISHLVEDKMYLLNDIQDFHNKDEQLANAIEELESALSEDLEEKFDNVIRLNYQIESYYFTLAYFLGRQHGSNVEKI